MLSVYPACFFKEDNRYSVIFPDLNVSTCGETLNDAMVYAVDCLAGYLYTCQTENEEFPLPSSLENISPESVAKDLDFSFEHAFVNMITVDVASYARDNFQKSVKKTLTIPTWLNKLALENNINFSHVLQEALKKKLHVD